MKLANQNTQISLGHLTYCSNIHPGESWPEVRKNLDDYLPDIKAALTPDAELGIGLRLSAAATKELAQPEAMAEFQRFLSTSPYYVFTINAFPYGPFHGTPVKENVYLPDWKDDERLRYTNQTADVFSKLLPAGVTGSISTVPGAFKARVNSDQDIAQMRDNMVKHTAHLVQIERDTGKSIVLALEPEPCCFLETIDESVTFFSESLYGDDAVALLTKLASVDKTQALALLRKHLTLCLDLCHAAVEFENPDECIDKLKRAGISIGKLQISAGLRLQDVNTESAELLRPFDDNVYLHQVVERHNDTVSRFKDLPDAFASLENTDPSASSNREWRVHFHVPVFLDQLDDFSSTQFFIRDILARHKTEPLSDHLEVETYTWNVLPETYRAQPMGQAIARELNWVVEQLS